jgi:hypothetical protein
MHAKDFSEEEHSLFNPAYIGFLLFTMIREYSRESETGMHCSLPFLLLPITLNPTIAIQLPSDKRSSLLAWISSHQGELGNFAELARNYQPLVMKAIAFLMEKSLLLLNHDGEFLLGSATVPKNPSIFSKSESMRNAMRAANFMGRWFAHAPPIETLYAQLGVRP